ncbi:uncharacterized protein [Procambarus clarkii]|uniref:uncharacterized protein n=1 Tax=Procambarus clarkii TaxID=6728 RepID=UPI003744A163
MLAALRKRKGPLFYLVCSVAVLAFCFVTSASRSSRSHTRDAYPWQMINYDEYDCGCPRSGPPVSGSSEQSLCSDWSTSRGAGQKVVSYTIYGDMNHKGVYRQYYSAIEDRIKDVDKHYTGWILRLYHNISRSDLGAMGFICRLYCHYQHFDPCQVDRLYPTHQTRAPKPQHSPASTFGSTGPETMVTAHIRESNSRGVKDGTGYMEQGGESERSSESEAGVNTHSPRSEKRILSHLHTKLPRREGQESYEKLLVGKMWRFLPMGDPLVTEFLVRDTDSAILAREVAAVDQWLHNSTALVHLMRDHPSHNGLILAGMWGGSRTRGASKMTEMLRGMLRWPPRDIWDYDQVLLKRVVWPEILDTVLAHDSYFCGNPHFRSHHRSQPFPTQRQDHYFVGWGPTRDHELPGVTKCPSLCRPPQHQDWLYC